eukprot:TRINITY_DN2221_c0_g1_i6.p1 TRINITY_DN2221_c0_g1~~TRINITY_DN2221_c0_g1_i6.p1  ORF type:complete len:147 (-),score=34.36 TRINITY_DN2221_c0_g1_i6:464-904(-)
MSTITETTGESEFSDKSVFSNNQSEIHDMPFSALVKPTAQELEEDKVESLMESLENGKDVTPIDVMWVQGSEGGNYYFGNSINHSHNHIHTHTISHLTHTPTFPKNSPNLRKKNPSLISSLIESLIDQQWEDATDTKHTKDLRKKQ